MASKRSRVRVRRNPPQTAEEDRISNLPECVLSHILSFLPTEDSVRTRSVSTRWKHLYSSVPLLDFTYPSSTKPLLSYSSSSDPNAVLPFLDFVDSVFNSYSVQKMEFLRIKMLSEPHPDYSCLLSSVSESIRRGVRELIFHVPFYYPQLVPTCVFTCQTITYLSIRARRLVFDVPEDVCLPQLNTLEIADSPFIDADSIYRFFRGCPVLENLCLESCFREDIFNISVPSLKSLVIVRALSGDDFHLVLNLPKIEKFTCIDSMIGLGSFSFHGFELLVEANICFVPYSSEGYKALDKLVHVVSNAQKLKFLWSTLGSFQRTARTFPLFCNLTCLELRHSLDLDSGLVLDLLDKTPRLEILVVKDVRFTTDDCDGSGVNVHFSPERVPACVPHNLKEVSFEGFFREDIEFVFIKYLLENAKILNTLKIWPRLPGKQFKLNKKLLSFPRCSRACQIVVKPDTNKI